MKTLEKNCELAREYVRQTGKIPPIPTIDMESLEKYPNLVKVENAVKEEKTSPIKNKTTTKKTTVRKTTKTKEEKDGTTKKVEAHKEVPTHE